MTEGELRLAKGEIERLEDDIVKANAVSSKLLNKMETESRKAVTDSTQAAAATENLKQQTVLENVHLKERIRALESELESCSNDLKNMDLKYEALQKEAFDTSIKLPLQIHETDVLKDKLRA